MGSDILVAVFIPYVIPPFSRASMIRKWGIYCVLLCNFAYFQAGRVRLRFGHYCTSVRHHCTLKKCRFQHAFHDWKSVFRSKHCHRYGLLFLFVHIHPLISIQSVRTDYGPVYTATTWDGLTDLNLSTCFASGSFEIWFHLIARYMDCFGLSFIYGHLFALRWTWLHLFSARSLIYSNIDALWEDMCWSHRNVHLRSACVWVWFIHSLDILYRSPQPPYTYRIQWH